MARLVNEIGSIPIESDSGHNIQVTAAITPINVN